MMVVNGADLVFVFFIVVIFIYDAWLRHRGGDPATFSHRIALWSMRYPLIPAMFGILIGHLFWPNRGYCP